MFYAHFRFLNDIDGAALGFQIGFGKVLAEDATGQLNGAADEQQQAGKCGKTRHWVSEEDCFDNDGNHPDQRSNTEQDTHD